MRAHAPSDKYPELRELIIATVKEAMARGELDAVMEKWRERNTGRPPSAV
jgi:hypothetical protein